MTNKLPNPAEFGSAQTSPKSPDYPDYFLQIHADTLDPSTITIRNTTFTKLSPWGDDKRLPWIEALESGKYQQTQQRLHDAQGYCCLGVAVDTCGLSIHPASALLLSEDYLPAKGKYNLDKSGSYEEHIKSVPASNALVYLNDLREFSFLDIARFLRWAMLPLTTTTTESN